MMDVHTQGSTDVRKALQETVKLDDGRYGYVITETPSRSSVPTWHCHVCGRSISSERALFIHLAHPIHRSNLRVPTHPAGHFRKFSKSSNPSAQDNDDTKESDKKDNGNSKANWTDVATDVLPGEPVPPGMEGIVEGNCQLQKTIESFKGAPLIGLEYIVELVNANGEGEPRYACLLCEKRGDPRSVMVHLTSQNHYLKYISCFFRSAGNALNMFQRTAENRKGIYKAITKVAQEIEQHYGRLKPTVAIADTFASKKYEILREIDEKEHFRETPYTTFLHLVQPDKIKQYAEEEEQKFNAELKRNTDPSVPGSKPEEKSLPLKHGLPAPKQAIPAPKLTAPPPKPNVAAPNTLSQAEIKQEKKFAFQIGKPEKSFGRNIKPTPVEQEAQNRKQTQEADDDVIIIGEEKQECIEVNSMSSISSASDAGSPRKRMRRPPSRGRSRSRDRHRGRSPYRDRRVSPHRSRSRDRYRRSRSRDRYRRGYKDYRERDRGSPPRRRHDRYSEERRRGRSPYRKEQSRDRMDRSYERRERERRREKTPEHRRHISRESESQQKWDKYRSELKKLELEFEEKLKYYEDRPEKHPAYSEEWKNFWNRRYKEIQQTGKDPSTYDFKPEWIVFWGKRMKELNSEELSRKREELTKDMGMHNLRDKGPSSELQDISPPTPEDSRDITINDIRNTWKAMTGTEIAPPSDRRTPSPWEEREKFKHHEAHKKLDKELPPVRSTFNPSPPVIHCLRMLSVLENQLGSLGPKVLDLLAKALALEKTRPSESMTLLHDQDIHIFFETAKEKIRGQLLAGIVDRNLVSSCYAIIKAVDNMLAAHPPKAKHVTPQVVTPTPTPVTSEPVQVPGIGMIDKMAVAQQIAGALVAQGRTDVTTEELEDLINAVVGIARASNATVSQNTSSAAFFSQLNLKNSTANSHINEILGNMISTAQKTLGLPAQPTQTSVETQLQNPVTVPAQVAPALIVLPKPKVEIPAPKVGSEEMSSPTGDQVEQKISDQELKEKLINFSNLSRNEQQELIHMLKELENTQPERVETLRKYVSMGLAKSDSKETVENKEPEKMPPKPTSRLSPFSSRSGEINPSQDEIMKFRSETANTRNQMSDDDDDDDDYTYEDVYKAASAKVMNRKPVEHNEPTIQPYLINEESSTSHISFPSVQEPKMSVEPIPPLDIPYHKPDNIIERSASGMTKTTYSGGSIFNKLFHGNKDPGFSTIVNPPPSNVYSGPHSYNSESYPPDPMGNRGPPYDRQDDIDPYRDNYSNPPRQLYGNNVREEDEFSSDPWQYQDSRDGNRYPPNQYPNPTNGSNDVYNSNQGQAPNRFNYYGRQY